MSISFIYDVVKERKIEVNESVYIAREILESFCEKCMFDVYIRIGSFNFLCFLHF